MRLLIRVGRRLTAHFAGVLFIGATLLLLAMPGRARAAHPSPTRRAEQHIIVNRIDGTPSTDSDISPTTTGITLTDAIAQAARDPQNNVIKFDPSVFGREPVVFSISRPITVNGAVAGHDRIDAASTGCVIILDGTSCPDAGIIVSSQGQLTLAGLTIQGGRQRAILVKDAGQLTLDNVTIRASSGPGIACFGQAHISLVGCQLFNNATHGLELHGQSLATLDQVELIANKQSGLAGFGHSIINATDCRLDANGDWSVVLTHNCRTQMIRCRLQRSGFANADVSESASLTCQDTCFDEGRRFGIFATGHARIELKGVTLCRHGSRAIELQDQAALTMSESRIDANDDYGIILFGQSTIHATASLIARNGAHGVSLRNGASGYFSDCAFVSNHYSGIGCLDDSQGGKIRATQCTYHQNGMRPIYRGPLHLDPVVPTPLNIQGPIVHCLADPNATIELYLDRVGEAAQYVETIHANDQGRFQVDCRNVPEGWVMTAAATCDGATSEFNVIAGTTAEPVLSALLGQTGPLSDHGGNIDHKRRMRRWQAGTHLILHIPNPPSVAVERYTRFLVQRIQDWTNGTISASVAIGLTAQFEHDAVIVPIHYLNADTPQLMGRGGVTFMKWDADGYFLSPMKIVLATAAEPQNTCPRVLAHEIGHVLGLCHSRVGLLSRMQGSIGCSKAFVNDFSPIMTYYDVLALQVLHDPRHDNPITLQQVLVQDTGPDTHASTLAGVSDPSAKPLFSPPPDQTANQPTITNRR